MSIESVCQYLARWGRDKDIIVMEESTATVALAAAALGVIPARIAKSISLRVEKDGVPAAMVVVTAGDVKLDNRKYKDRFDLKAKMLSPGEALEYTGHAVGGVCPFALPPGVEVYLDVSLQRFQTVYPACGSGNSAIELTMDELKEYSASLDWVDVCAPIGA
ncbi:YbaK/EbsC family protein [Leadbettera azotonutricia]|uniref:YbaK/prolyl-tRNA synthetase associated region n=1 Tax=Leadbettera azotonutricia (strain ATCC BAA-888 / DSM 13862 / ZAS-9) TaxID=545695 RepID=F5YGG4_LEAAZ|nr:YbaK/EbsC family protein [Leadbettera azotonutricia]AEF83282.1 YbaK/prolyl-tRNA synthetase associated region [Leadbettera azotonutricia ZAS-9]